MQRSLLFIRTHKTLSGGGPVPPMGLMYIISSIMKSSPGEYDIKLIDTGLVKDIGSIIEESKPDIVGISSLSCEADLMHDMARIVKGINKNTTVIAGGPHPTLLKEKILEDKNIDIAVIGEGEISIKEILQDLKNGKDLSVINGIIFRYNEKIIVTDERDKHKNIEDFDLIDEVYEIINLNEYSKYKNWSGSRKKKLYLPVLSSRGCPYSCTFCRSKDIFGQEFRARSPENVVNEIVRISRRYNISEIHFFDDVFNYDNDRAKKICALLIKTKKKWNIVFPNGLRADIMDDDLLDLLRKAGTYKIHYGIETVSERLQKMIGKYLNISKAEKIIKKTASRGIITSGYFMLGFPTETKKEMQQTIDFAVNSSLDNAFFFKFTDFLKISADIKDDTDLHFYSRIGSASELSESELNMMLLKAQKYFYLSIKRIVKGFLRAPHKIEFIINLIQIIVIMVQTIIISNLGEEDK